MQPQTVKIARRLVRPSDPLSRNASLRGGVAARSRAAPVASGDRREGAEEDADFVSVLFAFAVVFSQNCMVRSLAEKPFALSHYHSAIKHEHEYPCLFAHVTQLIQPPPCVHSDKRGGDRGSGHSNLYWSSPLLPNCSHTL